MRILYEYFLWVKCSQTIEQELQNPTLGYDQILLTTWERQLTRNGKKRLDSVINQLEMQNRQTIADKVGAVIQKQSLIAQIRKNFGIKSKLEKTFLIEEKKHLTSKFIQLKIPNMQDPTKFERNTRIVKDLRKAQLYAKLLNRSQIFKQHIEHIRESLKAKIADRIDHPTSEDSNNSNVLRLLPQPIENFDKELSALQWETHNLLVQSLLQALTEREIPFSVDEWKEVVQSLEPLPHINPEPPELSDIMQIPLLAFLKERCDITESRMWKEATEDYKRLWNASGLCSTYFSLDSAALKLQTLLTLISSAQEGGQSSLSRGSMEEKDLITQRLYSVMQQMSSFRELYPILLRKYIRASFDIWNAQMWSNIWNAQIWSNICDAISEKSFYLSSLKEDLAHLPTEDTASGPTALELTESLLTVIETMKKAHDMCTRDPQALLEMFKIPIANMRKVCPEFPQHVLLLDNSPLSPEEKSKLRIQIIQDFFKDTSLSYTSLAKAKTELMSQLHLEPTDILVQDLDLAFTCETKMREYFASITQ